MALEKRREIRKEELWLYLAISTRTADEYRSIGREMKEGTERWLPLNEVLCGTCNAIRCNLYL